MNNDFNPITALIEWNVVVLRAWQAAGMAFAFTIAAEGSPIWRRK